eukprot:Pgem_evm1s2243
MQIESDDNENNHKQVVFNDKELFIILSPEEQRYELYNKKKAELKVKLTLLKKWQQALQFGSDEELEEQEMFNIFNKHVREFEKEIE